MRMPTYFIPHGGSPCFFMEWNPADTWNRMEAWLRAWHTAPGVRDAHPREEHLIPLMVAAGAAGGDVGKRMLLDYVMSAPVSAYGFGV